MAKESKTTGATSHTNHHNASIPKMRRILGSKGPNRRRPFTTHPSRNQPMLDHCKVINFSFQSNITRAKSPCVKQPPPPKTSSATPLRSRSWLPSWHHRSKNPNKDTPKPLKRVPTKQKKNRGWEKDVLPCLLLAISPECPLSPNYRICIITMETAISLRLAYKAATNSKDHCPCYDK